MKLQLTEDELLAYFVQSKYWPTTEWEDFIEIVKKLGVEIIENKENKSE